MTPLSHRQTPPGLRRRTTLALAALALSAGLAGCSGAAGAALPSDFPAAVTVAEGTVLAAEQRDGAWTVNVKLDRNDTRQAALERLTGAGFAITGESGEHGNDRVYSLANDEYSVRLGISTIDGEDLLNYTVAERRTAQ